MHKFVRAAAAAASGVALTFTATVASELPASAAACSTTFSSYNTIRAGSSGGQAKAAQCLLDKAGYQVKADGSFSSADASQLRKFQGKVGLSRTGKVTASSWSALLARGSRPVLDIGDQGSAVTRLQKALTATGRSVPVTGYFGSATKGAVVSLQRAERLPANGVAGVAVWRALQSGSATAAKASGVEKSATVSASSRSKGAIAVAFAKKQVGDRYRYGATGPNAWDCSGLTQGAWRAAGKKLPHSARQQFKMGKKVSRSNLRPGDLVFFYRGISHVAIYAGNGKVIHAANPSKPVQYLKMSYMPFQGARRVG